MVIPAHRLPPGFLEASDAEPAEPAPARPAATTALLRDGVAGLEVLLLQRQLRSGFVPGAFVFPGGRLDAADAEPRLESLLTGPPPAEPPLPYRIAAVREVFEETGVLLATGPAGAVPLPHRDAGLLAARADLLAERTDLGTVLAARELRIDPGALAYFAHWITPRAEPRRFDTRFFMAALPAGQEALPDPREVSDAAWLTPAAALQRFADGQLPMVFPTVHSLELLVPYPTVSAALRALADCRVTAILPRLRRGRDGVELIVEPEVS
jgi:8-oxo-dGTP pyrophosphatase MutT (NUDIX family)